MEFTDREKFVLEAIIDYYLNSGEAIGSRTLVKKYGMELSSATIRNIMSDLEDTGYISKLHTSSGRAPTTKGYKYYLEKLLEVQRLTEEEVMNVKHTYEKRITELEEVLERTSRLLSRMSKNAGVVIEPGLERDKIKKIELVYVNAFTLMAVIVSEDSSVKTKKIHLEQSIQERETKEISAFLNNKLNNLSTTDVFVNIENFVNQKRYEIINDVFKNCIQEDDGEVFIEGAPGIIENLGRENPDNIQGLIKVLDGKDEIKKIFLELAEVYDASKGKVNVVLGEDLNLKGLEDLSFVFSVYTLGNNSKGIIGIIGPKRMEYSRNVGILEYITDELNVIIAKIKGGT